MLVVFYNKLSWFVSEIPEKDISNILALCGNVHTYTLKGSKPLIFGLLFRRCIIRSDFGSRVLMINEEKETGFVLFLRKWTAVGITRITIKL